MLPGLVKALDQGITQIISKPVESAIDWRGTVVPILLDDVTREALTWELADNDSMVCECEALYAELVQRFIRSKPSPQAAGRYLAVTWDHPTAPSMKGWSTHLAMPFRIL